MPGSISAPTPTQHQERDDSVLRRLTSEVGQGLGRVPAAHASAAAVVIPSLWVVGAVIALVALVAMPGKRLEAPGAPRDKVEAGFAS
jgi:hypothetical protein